MHSFLSSLCCSSLLHGWFFQSTSSVIVEQLLSRSILHLSLCTLFLITLSNNTWQLRVLSTYSLLAGQKVLPSPHLSWHHNSSSIPSFQLSTHQHLPQPGPPLGWGMQHYQISVPALNLASGEWISSSSEFSMTALLGFWFLRVRVQKQAIYPKSKG